MKTKTEAGEQTHKFNPDSSGMVCRTCQKHFNVHSSQRPRNGAQLVSETLSDGSLVWNVALVIGEETIIVNMQSHFAAESFAKDFNHRVACGHIVGA